MFQLKSFTIYCNWSRFSITRKDQATKKTLELEICVDCIESALNAAAGGADRIELCSALIADGLTPSLGLLREIKERINIPVFVMIRPRPGDFCYDKNDLQVMLKDVESLRELADGFVFGILNSAGEIDIESCRMLATECLGKPITIHRAVDASRCPVSAVKTIVSELSDSVSRILSSGGKRTATDGVSTLHEMVAIAAHTKIRIMAGSGVRSESVPILMRDAEVRSLHGSASVVISGQRWGEAGIPHERRITGEQQVRALRHAIQEFAEH